MDDNPVHAPVANSPFGRAGAPRTSKPPLSRSILLIVLVVLAAGGLAFILSKCAGQGSGPRGQFPFTTVGVAKAAYGDLPIELDALGTVTSRATVAVTSRIAGNLVSVPFREGQMVKQGQVIAEVDERPYVIALQQAQGQLLRDQAALDNSRLILSRDRTLLAQDSIARQDVDTQAAAVKSNEGVVRTDQAAVANARLNLVYCKITAPVSGRIGLRQVDVGNYVTAGGTGGIAVITQIDPIDVVFTVPEDQVPLINQRMRSGAVLPVQALDRAGGQVLAQGVLSTLDNQIDVTTGTVKGKAAFDNADSALFPNQFVNVRVLVNTLKNAVIVPASAIRHGPQGDFVWIMTPQRKAHMQPVKIGPSLGEQASIQWGVQVGQTVITEGGDRLREGAPVALPGQRPPAFGGRGGRGGRRSQFGGSGGGPGGYPGQGAPGPGGGQGGAPNAEGSAARFAGRPPASGAPAGQFWRHRQDGQFQGGQDQQGAGQGFGGPGGPGGRGQFWRHRHPGGPGGGPDQGSGAGQGGASGGAPGGDNGGG